MTKTARIPSSVKVGGIRTSATTTSGCSRSTAATSSAPSPAVATTWKPALSSNLVSPASNSTESSAITTRWPAPGASVTGTTLCLSLRPQGRGGPGPGGPAGWQQGPGHRYDQRPQRQQGQPSRREHLGQAGRDAGMGGSG